MIEKKLYAQTREAKKKRKVLKYQRSCQTSKKRKNERFTYESDIGLTGALEISLEETPHQNLGAIQEMEQYKIFYFDTETTGLSGNDQKVQVRISLFIILV